MFNAVIKQQQSSLDIQNEVNQLIDTLQMHVEFNPDDDIRINTKDFAILLSQLIIVNKKIKSYTTCVRYTNGKTIGKYMDVPV